MEENGDPRPILNLEWHGPYRIGHFPENVDELRNMRGVYVLHNRYDESDRNTLYVGSVTGRGRLRSIHMRIREHYGGILGFGYWLRDGAGNWDNKTDPETAAFTRLDDLDSSFSQSAREARRLCFYYAAIADNDLHLGLQAESLLVESLRNKFRDQDKVDIENLRLPVGISRINLILANKFMQSNTPLGRFLPSKISAPLSISQ